MNLIYLYPDGLKKVQACILVVLQYGKKARSSLAIKATGSVHLQKQHETASPFLRMQQGGHAKGTDCYQKHPKGSGNCMSCHPTSPISLQLLKDSGQNFQQKPHDLGIQFPLLEMAQIMKSFQFSFLNNFNVFLFNSQFKKYKIQGSVLQQLQFLGTMNSDLFKVQLENLYWYAKYIVCSRFVMGLTIYIGKIFSTLTDTKTMRLRAIFLPNLKIRAFKIFSTYMTLHKCLLIPTHDTIASHLY